MFPVTACRKLGRPSSSGPRLPASTRCSLLLLSFFKMIESSPMFHLNVSMLPENNETSNREGRRPDPAAPRPASVREIGRGEVPSSGAESLGEPLALEARETSKRET